LYTLTEEKNLLIQQYVDLLDTIEDAFGYILVSLEKLRLNVVEQLWEFQWL
jgi:hypothetical protein